MDLKGCAQAFLRGLFDSIRGTITIAYLDKELNNRKLSRLSPTKAQTSKASTGDSTPIRGLRAHEESKVLTRIIQCCALNGGVFLLSIILFQYGFLPGFGFVVKLILGSESSMGKFIWNWMEPVLTCIFQTLWVVPLFLLSKVVNSLWFQDIADSAYRYSRGRPQFMQSISMLLADSIFSIAVQTLFLFQALLVNYIPIYMLGTILSTVHMCLLYSLYAFEYKWFNMGWELHKRLTYIETNWPYFIGFGLPLAILTNLSESWFISGCIFAIAFPLFIISGNQASPMTGVCDYPLHLFSPVITLSNALLTKTLRQAPNAGNARR
ncbi:hypothetical protein PPYR_07449 [Photinus pyralis]|uniref:Etoposide-induced protein 2.4 homolog n=1 Tax=Photinus pyralis TaxID=7054 RepID=A0A1Y1KRF8_PHOPY|nr:etoposide-induced protein 2.4 homolog [Photinus pyralis]KAB0799569.1 hypothetical protein PPYR_07449 [Photinus pyralis]